MTHPLDTITRITPTPAAIEQLVPEKRRSSSLLSIDVPAAPRRGVIMRSITSYRDRVMDRPSSFLILASGNHGGALVFTIGVGVVVLIAIYMFAKGRR
jgi:hypothetical protein